MHLNTFFYIGHLKNHNYNIMPLSEFEYRRLNFVKIYTYFQSKNDGFFNVWY